MQAPVDSGQPAKIHALPPHVEDVAPAEYELTPDLCIIGRRKTCQIVVNLAPVSRSHAWIEISEHGPRYILYDNRSTNGTFVNGLRIDKPHVLSHDDEIGLGSVVPILHFLDPDQTSVAESWFWHNDRVMAFYFKQQKIQLPPSEYQLLLHLYRHANSVCTRASCAEAIWQKKYDSDSDDDRLNQSVANLRKALQNTDPTLANLLSTQRGYGYMLDLSQLARLSG